jgi:transcriptional regulator with XRE-family HTH domain
MSNIKVPVTPEGTMFGAALRRLREERKMSQEKLANHPRLGSDPITSSYISDLERGLKVPSLTTILKLSYALDCSVTDLLSDFSPSAVRRLLK